MLMIVLNGDALTNQVIQNLVIVVMHRNKCVKFLELLLKVSLLWKVPTS